jgi:propanediol dehydratase small subunit
MRKKNSIKKNDVVPEGLQETVIAQKITSDFVLELYEKSKKLRGKKKKQLLAVAEELSKHVGKYLAE